MIRFNVDAVPAIKEALIRGAILREPVETTEYNRGIGKTTALIQFAQEYGFTVVVSHRMMADELKRSHGYENIISESDVGRQPIETKFVYDEMVNQKAFDGVKHVITGFSLTRY